ncbi:hypothetical protein ACFSR7_36310 [Cohnella sp. GCM10020058]|uniref:hypothetical protein n=1 Tax=Cohnella sp. GCM10020058 TaxID=3317330 RepID=UPI00363271A4
MSNLKPKEWSSFKLEWSIIEDKLAQGVNGVEWLVLSIMPKPRRVEMLPEWVEMLQMYDHDVDSAMLDALRMDSESYYERYEFNWWMAVSYTLTHLHLLRQRSYEDYFRFIQRIERSENN